MARLEDNKEVDPSEIPPMIYRTSLEPFNDWDTREFPESIDDIAANLKAMSSAYDTDAAGMRDYVFALGEALRYDVVENPITAPAWEGVQKLSKGLRSLKRKNDAHYTTIAEDGFPSLEVAYETVEWNKLFDAYRNLYGNVLEMQMIHRKISLMLTKIAAAVENSLDDWKEFEQFRMERYELFRGRLVEGRNKERTALRKEGIYV